MRRTYRVQPRTGTQRTGRKGFMLGLPWQIAEAIPEHVEFIPELTSEGILYRPVQFEPEEVVQDVPLWVRHAQRAAGA